MHVENLFSGFEDVHQQIVLPKLHENLTLPGGVDSISEAGSQQAQKLSQLPLVTSDFHETVKFSSSEEYLQIHRQGFSISTVKVRIRQIIMHLCEKSDQVPTIYHPNIRRYLVGKETCFTDFSS